MDKSAAVAQLSALAAPTCGVFDGCLAVAHGVTRHQLADLCAAGVLRRALPGIYCLTAVAPSDEQRLRATLLWAGPDAIACGRSAGVWYGLEGVRAPRPEVAIPGGRHARHDDVDVSRVTDLKALMAREHRGLRVTGPEATLVRLAHLLDDEAFEIAFEDARRRRRISGVAAMHAYLDRHARPGQRGVAPMRSLLRVLDPIHPSRSTLEVKTRRLLVGHGLREFVREHPLGWNGRTYRFDFTFLARRTILETNGRRLHDDPSDFEHDQEKWSVPGRHGYKLVLATWDKVTRDPGALVDELRTTLAA